MIHDIYETKKNGELTEKISFLFLRPCVFHKILMGSKHSNSRERTSSDNSSIVEMDPDTSDIDRIKLKYLITPQFGLTFILKMIKADTVEYFRSETKNVLKMFLLFSQSRLASESLLFCIEYLEIERFINAHTGEGGIKSALVQEEIVDQVKELYHKWFGVDGKSDQLYITYYARTALMDIQTHRDLQLRDFETIYNDCLLGVMDVYREFLCEIRKGPRRMYTRLARTNTKRRLSTTK